MTKLKRDAISLVEYYRHSGAIVADQVYGRIVEKEKLNRWQAMALRAEFRKMLKASDYLAASKGK